MFLSGKFDLVFIAGAYCKAHALTFTEGTEPYSVFCAFILLNVNILGMSVGGLNGRSRPSVLLFSSY